MTLEELERLHKHHSYNASHYKSLVPSNIEQLQKEYEEKKKRNFNHERRMLMEDPKNQVKAGLFSFGFPKVTDECERQCRALDTQERMVSNLGSQLQQHSRNSIFYEEELSKLTKVSSQIKKLLKQQEVLKRKKVKHEELKVRAKRNEEEIRTMATNVKRIIREVDTHCPYCGDHLGENPHADHIYPVSKGGLSVSMNMVMVCSKCNLKKKDLTLREFITKFSLNRDEIEKRLEELDKSF